MLSPWGFGCGRWWEDAQAGESQSPGRRASANPGQTAGTLLFQSSRPSSPPLPCSLSPALEASLRNPGLLKSKGTSSCSLWCQADTCSPFPPLPSLGGSPLLLLALLLLPPRFFCLCSLQEVQPTERTRTDTSLELCILSEEGGTKGMTHVGVKLVSV